jgi:uncharacterized protein YndB with AHSA1/START domain
MADIMHRVRVAAPVDKVYAALATEAGVRAWWSRTSRLDETVGGEGELAFHDRKVVTRLRVDALEPSQRVLWTVLESNAPGGWPGTTIAFDLTDEGGRTRIDFAHRGYAEADEGYAIVTTGWAFYLTSLRQLLETGKGAPHPEDGTLRIVQ